MKTSGTAFTIGAATGLTQSPVDDGGRVVGRIGAEGPVAGDRVDEDFVPLLIIIFMDFELLSMDFFTVGSGGDVGDSLLVESGTLVGAGETVGMPFGADTPPFPISIVIPLLEELFFTRDFFIVGW